MVIMSREQVLKAPVLLNGLLQDELVAALFEGDYDVVTQLLCNAMPTGDLPPRPLDNYILGLLLRDEGFFARQAASGANVPLALLDTLAEEIDLLQDLVAAYPCPKWLCGSNESLPEGWPDNLKNWRNKATGSVASALKDFYKSHGVGKLALGRVWRWDGELKQVLAYDRIRLHDLVGYQSQKDEVMHNTQLFLTEGRGNNMLLYGARGTGKSSLIKAVANELAESGLCLVELPLNRIADLPHLQEILHKQPRHYIIFIDDLSFERADEDYKITKAVLEGSVSGRGGNVLIYATSNRRHLVVEDWQDRQNMQQLGGEVRAGDSMSEKLSLADRFGQVVLFSTPDQEEYLQIVQELAAAEGVDMPDDELKSKALKWVMWQNGRSGRAARQFVNSLALNAQK